jgi:hypothetical protein
MPNNSEEAGKAVTQVRRVPATPSNPSAPLALDRDLQESRSKICVTGSLRFEPSWPGLPDISDVSRVKSKDRWTDGLTD